MKLEKVYDPVKGFHALLNSVRKRKDELKQKIAQLEQKLHMFYGELYAVTQHLAQLERAKIEWEIEDKVVNETIKKDEKGTPVVVSDISEEAKKRQEDGYCLYRDDSGWCPKKLRTKQEKAWGYCKKHAMAIGLTKKKK